MYMYSKKSLPREDLPVIRLSSHTAGRRDASYSGESWGDVLTSLTRQIDWRSLTAFLLPFSIYLLTLAPTVYNLDSAELSIAAYTGGLMRSTGYPLYLTIGYFWSRIPLGDVGFRMNLFSAVCGGMTIMLAERIMRRWKIGRLASFAGLGLLAVSTYFWGLSLVAEVYTLHTALMAGFILALLRWGDEPTPRRIFWVGLLGGLGMTHHAAMVLLGPASLIYIVFCHPRKLFSTRVLFAAAAGTLLGLIPFLYLPIRYLAQPVFNYAGTIDENLLFHPIDLTTLDGFIWLISGRSFASAMLGYRGSELWHETQAFLVQLGRAFFGAGIGPGLLGMVLLFRRSWREGLLLLFMFVFSAGFYINYRVLDKDTMYLPAYLIWALWAVIGIQWIIDWLDEAEPAGRLRSANLAVKTMMAVFVLVALGWNWGIVDLSHDRTARERGEAILMQAEPGALIFGWWDTVPVIQYLQLVEGQRPDVSAVNRFFINDLDMASAILKEVKYRPIYIDSLPRGISAALTARPDGPIYRLKLRDRPSEAGAMPTFLEAGQQRGLTGGER